MTLLPVTSRKHHAHSRGSKKEESFHKDTFKFVIGFNIFMGKLSQVDTLLVNFAGVFLNRVQRELNAHRPVQRTGATEM